jgi:hypothetical protein
LVKGLKANVTISEEVKGEKISTFEDRINT